MKKTYQFAALFLAILFLVISCAGSGDGSWKGENENPGSVKEDYLSVTPSGSHDVRMVFLNVGKADAACIIVDGHAWLIDTGTSASVPILFAGLENLGISSLDGVMITHTDNDHVGGLSALLDEVAVSAVYTSSISSDWNKVEELRGEIPRVALDSGEVVLVTEGVWFEVLGPIRYNSRDDNNSLVVRLRVNGATAIFAGDMMFEEENTLLGAEMDLKCDLLKVGHHGKKDATSKQFADACSPDVAIISANRERRPILLMKRSSKR
ncbi:MAG: MBL fold metallo-hydrolase [Oscillospiraceae bacterium]|nr:MBL fold metallo-hydrolase [Oscillospiraceae bacterium]